MLKNGHQYLIFLSLLIAGFLFGACRFNPPFQGRGTGVLQGEWRQYAVPGQKQLITYSLYSFRFSCDSFFVRMENFSKVNFGADSCMSKGHWFEYAKGAYDQHTDTLHLKGFYCNADYSLKKEGGCFNSGIYEDSFKIKPKADTAFAFISLNNSIPVELKLSKRLTCTPKPL